MDEEYLKQATLLYVEDEELIRTFLEKKLSRKVKKLHVAANGQEGYEKFIEHKPDIILTDITMPKLNGIDMAKKIKEIDKNIPIIIMSAHSDTTYLLQAIELGINGYLLKPIDKEKLLSTLESNVKNIFIEKELLEKKKQLLHQSRFALLGEMISMIAHQWRQPLNIISMSLITLKMKFESDKLDLKSENVQKNLPIKVCQYLEETDVHVQNLSKVIDDFANFYKTSNKTDCICINSPVQKAVETFRYSTSIEGITLNEQYNCTKNSNIYEHEFYQICLNLLNNSYEKFKEKDIKNPQINISTKDIEEGVEVTISDNEGIIPEDIIDKIYDPYFSTKTGKNGNGLGLYMSKLVIEEHLNGEIYVENEDNGVKFTIKLKE